MKRPLSPTAKRLLVYLRDQFAEGWTGDMQFSVHQGGVSDFKETSRPKLRETTDAEDSEIMGMKG